MIDLCVILLGQSCYIKEHLQYQHCIGHCSTYALDISIGHHNPIVPLLDLCLDTVLCLMIYYVLNDVVFCDDEHSFSVVMLIE